MVPRGGVWYLFVVSYLGTSCYIYTGAFGNSCSDPRHMFRLVRERQGEHHPWLAHVQHRALSQDAHGAQHAEFFCLLQAAGQLKQLSVHTQGMEEGGLRSPGRQFVVSNGVRLSQILESHCR